MPSPEAWSVKLRRYVTIVSVYCCGSTPEMIASSSAWRESAKLGKSAKADIATAMSGTSERSVVSVIEDATS